MEEEEVRKKTAEEDEEKIETEYVCWFVVLIVKLMLSRLSQDLGRE